AIEQPLRQMAPQIRKEVEANPLSRVWRYMSLAAAAILVVALAWGLRPIKQPRPTAPLSIVRNYTELARVEPPAYQAAVTRGVETPAEQKFHQAMESYGKKDYKAAIAGLQESIGLNPTNDAAHFFLGSCYAIFTSPAEAIPELEPIANGSSP